MPKKLFLEMSKRSTLILLSEERRKDHLSVKEEQKENWKERESDKMDDDDEE